MVLWCEDLCGPRKKKKGNGRILADEEEIEKYAYKLRVDWSGKG